MAATGRTMPNAVRSNNPSLRTRVDGEVSMTLRRSRSCRSVAIFTKKQELE